MATQQEIEQDSDLVKKCQGSCPYCGSQNIVYTGNDSSWSVDVWEVGCWSCKKEFQETYGADGDYIRTYYKGE